MTRLAALHARITGDSKGFVSAAVAAENASDRLTASMGTQGGKTGVAPAAQRTGGALAALSRSPGMRMLPVQLSQVAQQAAAGTNVMRALSIQAADIGLAFGTVGAIIGTLATIAMPAIIGMFNRTDEQADQLADGLDALEGAFGRVQNQQEALIGLRESYVEAINNSNDILAANLQQEIELRSNILRVERALVAQEIASMKRLRSSREDEIALVRERIDQEIAMLDLNGPGQEAARRERVNEITQRHIAQNRELFDGQKRLNNEIELMELEIERADMAIDEATGSMGEFDAATIRARQNAEALANVIESMGSSVAGGRGTVQDDRAQLRTQFEEQLETDDDKPSGSSGGGAAKVDRFGNDLEQLRNQLATQIETEREMHEARNEMLREAKERELLTEQEYAGLIERERARHNDAMVGLDVWRYGSQLDKMQTFMGQMSGAFASGNEEMLQVAKVFGASEALINAWRAYGQVMSDPSLPWFAKLPAAVSLFGSAVQAVSAIQGVGKGGSGQRSPGGGSAPSAEAPSAGGESQVRRTLNVAIYGDTISRQQAESLLVRQNEFLDNGGEVRFTGGGRRR